MKIGTLYISKHAYERLVERTFTQLKWNEKQYSLKEPKDYLHLFLDELFSQSLKVGVDRKRKNVVLGELKIYDAKLVIPIEFKHDKVCIPTVLEKNGYIQKEKLIKWIYPVKIAPYEIYSSLNHQDRAKIQINYSKFEHDLDEYARERNFVELKKYDIKDKVLIYPFAGKDPEYRIYL